MRMCGFAVKSSGDSGWETHLCRPRGLAWPARPAARVAGRSAPSLQARGLDPARPERIGSAASAGLRGAAGLVPSALTDAASALPDCGSTATSRR